MHLAIILARKNSKRLKNKNLLKIGKFNLIQLALIETLKVKNFSKIIINTDYENIEKEFKFLKKNQIKKIEFHKRSAKLAGHKSKSVDAVLESIKKIKSKKFLTVTVILPTCPFRKSFDIIKGLKALTKKCSTVISVCKTDFPPQFSFYKKNKRTLKPIFKNCPLITSERRTQDFSNTFRPNGGFYISWINKLKKNKNFFRGKLLGVEMPSSRSVDIDTYEDLLYARYISKKIK